MARTFFDQVLVTEAPKRGRKWMRAVSILLHVGIVLAVFVLPLTAAFELPNVYTTLPPVVLATVSPLPPPPQPQAAPPVANTAPSIPIEAPEGVHEEKPAPPPVAVAPPGVLPGVGSAGTSLVNMNNSTISLAKAPESAPQVPRRVGGDVVPPQRIAYTAPQFPPAAQAARMEGTVVLEAIIDATGVVQDVKVLKSVPLLDRAAVEAVRQWRYTPTRLNGVAIPVIMSVTVTFSLR
jgi:protein TonB